MNSSTQTPRQSRKYLNSRVALKAPAFARDIGRTGPSRRRFSPGLGTNVSIKYGTLQKDFGTGGPSPCISRRVRTPVRAHLQSKASLPSRFAVIGNYLPRQCRIATLTTDLCAAISTECGSARLLALPVNDTEEGYDYPDRVGWSLAQDDLTSYQKAAEFLNFNNIDMVCLQHEYGIFGGPAGSHILDLLRGLKMPVVTTLNTVLREPNSDQLRVMKEIAELSDRLIVMSQLSSLSRSVSSELPEFCSDFPETKFPSSTPSLVGR